MRWKLKCVIEPEDDWYVSSCEELGIASQGETVNEAKENLEEAIEMFFEDASQSEILSLLAHLKPESPVEIQTSPGKSRLCSTRNNKAHSGSLLLPKLRRLSGRQVCRILSQHGFLEVRQKGSHIQMRKTVTLDSDVTTITVPIPNHRELKTGTLSRIIQRSQLDRSLFESKR